MLIKPDLLVVQPTHQDFPLFRHQVRKYRNLFNKVILAWSNHNVGTSMVKWIEEHTKLDDITYIDHETVAGKPFDDWGQRAIVAGVEKVESNYMLISQQDFIINNDKLLSTVLTDDNLLVSHHSRVFSENEAAEYAINRCEPDFIFINTDLFFKTSQNVSTAPGFDHWGKISVEFYELCLGKKRTLESYGFVSPDDWEHLQGLSGNYYRLMTNDFDRFWKRERFINYNKEILEKVAKSDIEPNMYEYIKTAASLV